MNSASFYMGETSKLRMQVIAIIFSAMGNIGDEWLAKNEDMT